MSDSFSILSDQVILPGEVGPTAATLEVRDGRIARVSPGANPSGGREMDFRGQGILAPGLVDVHAHINEPGRTEWEGFETATAACAAGGVTTVVDMPLNSIPATVTLEAFRAKREAAQGKCRVDYGLWGGIIPGSLGEIEPLADAGVIGFKVFLVPSGVDEFPNVGRKELEAAMPILARRGLPLIVHAELESPVKAQSQGGKKSGPRSYRRYLDSRPADWEVNAIRMMIELCAKTGCATHIVHLSAADALPDIARAKKQGLPFTAETCPHYLSLCAEEIAEGATQFKCAPPIREKSNQDRLWEGLRSGVIDFVTSDHSPCTPALKSFETGEFAKAWGGIASLQFTLPLVWTGARDRGVTLARVFEWLASRPARFAGLDSRKGSIAAGNDADLILFDAEGEFELTRESIRYRHPVSPYLGRKLRGRVLRTILRGEAVFADAAPASSALGQWLKREEGTRPQL